MIEVEKLQTERLILRKFTIKDLNDFIELRSDKSLYFYLPNGLKENLKDYKKELLKWIKRYKKHQGSSAIYFAIELKDLHKVVGAVSISGVKLEHKFCSIGWLMNKEYRNQGYAFEAVKCVIDYLFKNYQLNKIKTTIYSGNIASEKLALKLGFIQEGYFKQERYIGEKVFDCIEMSLFRE